MIDFRLSDELELFRRSVARIAEQEIAPLADECDREYEYPTRILKKLGDLGYLGVTFPKQYGGGELGTLAQVLLFEELGRASAGIALGIYCHAVLALTPIALFGTESQKQRYLISGIRGEKIGAFGMTEAGAGSDLTAMQTKARQEGDSYVIDGSKLFCTNAPFANFFVISAYTAPGQGIKGISLFIIDQETPGFSVGQRLPMLGMRPSQTAEVLLRSCRVPRESLLGDEDRGLYMALRSLTGGRIVAAALAIGLARAAYEATREYAKERVQFGQPIGKFQAIQFKIADMDTMIQAARLLTYKAAWLADQGLPYIKEASQAKLFATEACTRISEQALQIHGASGYMMESPIQRYYRDTKVLELGEGTSEIQRGIIAKQLGL